MNLLRNIGSLENFGRNKELEIILNYIIKYFLLDIIVVIVGLV